MNSDRYALDALKEFENKQAATDDSGWSLMMWGHLMSAVVYALLAISEAIYYSSEDPVE